MIKLYGAIINLAYQHKTGEISQLSEEIETLEQEYRANEIEEKTEIAFNKLNPQREELISERESTEQELQELERNIEELNAETFQNQLIVLPETNTFLGKIRNFIRNLFDKKKIKAAETKIELNNNKVTKLKQQQNDLKKRIRNINRRILLIEMKFKKEAETETTMEQYARNKKDKPNNSKKYDENRNTINEEIANLSHILSVKEEELNEIVSSGLVTIGVHKLEENETEKSEPNR